LLNPVRGELMLQGCVPWPEELARSYRRKGYWQDVSIPDFFSTLVAASPDRVAVTDGDRRLTLGELWVRSGHFAAQCHRLGLLPRQRVVFQLPNGADFPIAFLGLLRAGLIPVMALPSHRQTEITHYVKSADAVALLVPDRIKNFDFREMADAVKAEASSLRCVFVLGEAREGDIPLTTVKEPDSDNAAAIDRMRHDPGDVALMLLSGGTTALPKLIPRTHNDYIYNFTQSARVAGFGLDTVVLLTLPLAHNYNLGSPGMLGALAAGGRVVMAPRGDCETVFSLVEKERVTVIQAAVPLIVNWLNDPALDRFDISSLKLVQQGGARLAPELRDRLRKRLRCQFQEDYGTAEGLLNLTRLNDADDIVLRSSGAPICDDDEIKVLDDNGNEVADGEIGELVTRGPYTIRGYYNAPQINARSFTADGFYRMGDYVRKRGRYVFAEGRKNDLINRGGEKISVDEVENLILKHPAVHAVAIVAMPDPVFGERACAFVTLRDGANLTFAELCAFLLDQHIAKFKLPERLETLSQFPLSGAGKILRRTLREMIETKLRNEQTGSLQETS
jgi:2,3-dihydroxybenzoate-AMP ligase